MIENFNNFKAFNGFFYISVHDTELFLLRSEIFSGLLADLGNGNNHDYKKDQRNAEQQRT